MLHYFPHLPMGRFGAMMRVKAHRTEVEATGVPSFDKLMTESPLRSENRISLGLYFS